MGTELDKAKANITGTYLRINKTINDDFTRNSKDSLVETNKFQSKREVITQRLIEEYNKRGDNIFNVLDTNPF